MVDVDIKSTIPIPLDITSAQPLFISNDNDGDCAAAILTAGLSIALGIAWFDERKEALEKQKEVEDAIHVMMDDDDTHYKDVTHPQQIIAIQASLDAPVFSSGCEECYTSNHVEGLADGINTFLFKPAYADNEICEHTVRAHARTGLAQAYHDDVFFDKQLRNDSLKNKANILAKAKSSMHIDHSAKYRYMMNASAIQGGLAGMAAQGYASAVKDFNFALGVIGSPKAGEV